MLRHSFTVLPVRHPLLASIVLPLAVASFGHAWASDGQPLEAERPGLILVAQPTPVGQVENAVGTLVVKRADGRVERLRGKGSLALYEGDECKTERGSKAFIRLTDGTQLAINEDTAFAVRVRMETGRGITRIFKMLVGELWMKTSGPGPLEVQTPAATAAVKGTEFDIRVLPDGKSILTVIEGVVEFRNEFCSPCKAAKATQSVSEKGKRCTEPVPINAPPAIAWIADVVR